MSQRRNSAALILGIRFNALILLLAAVLVLPQSARAAGRAPAGPPDPTIRQADDILREAFRPVIAGARQSVVSVRCNGKEAVLGTVVSADGYIITKASELVGKITCRLPDGRELPATIIATHDKHDVALLKLAAEGLKPIEWGDSRKIVMGQLLASVGPEELPRGTGVVSELRRSIPPLPPFLGVGLDVDLAKPDPRGPTVTKIVPDSGAAKAGLKESDIITGIADVLTPTRVDLIRTLRKYAIGDKITVKLLREEKEMELPATLGRPDDEHNDTMMEMSGALSKHSDGFPVVFQHDTILRPLDCGSPVVGLDGKALGINIARAGRTESYTIPADMIETIIDRLKAEAK